MVHKLFVDGKDIVNILIVKHNDKYTTLYAHLSKYKRLFQGVLCHTRRLMGYVGSTGYSTGPCIMLWLY